MGSRGVYCEALASLLGAEIEAAVPAGAMAELAGVGRVWLSADVGLALPWDSGNPGGFDNVDAVGAAVALDAVLYNEDRHPGNALLTEAEDEALLWFIDWEAAILGFHTARLAANLDLVPNPATKHFRGLPVGAIEAGARSGATKLARLTDALDQILLTCAGYARLPPEDRGMIERVVRHRLEQAPVIVAAYLDRLWPLQ